MNDIVKSATALCTGAYVLVGFFGYVAFNNQIFSGNVMLYFSTSLASDIIKVGFFFSVACSFPLVVFPCRASLYSLLYRRVGWTTLQTEANKKKILNFPLVICSHTQSQRITSRSIALDTSQYRWFCLHCCSAWWYHRLSWWSVWWGRPLALAYVFCFRPRVSSKPWRKIRRRNCWRR